VFTSLKQGNTATAAFSMDMFSLGRIIQWLSVQDDNLWPDLTDPSNANKEAFLLSDTEFSLDGIQDDATLNIIKRLVKKSPQQRLNLDGLRACISTLSQVL
jgi:hypothetical protein